jgi:hypothetical protein
MLEPEFDQPPHRFPLPQAGQCDGRNGRRGKRRGVPHPVAACASGELREVGRRLCLSPLSKAQAASSVQQPHGVEGLGHGAGHIVGLELLLGQLELSPLD